MSQSFRLSTIITITHLYHTVIREGITRPSAMGRTMLRVDGESVELRGQAGARIFRRGVEPVEVAPVTRIDALLG